MPRRRARASWAQPVDRHRRGLGTGGVSVCRIARRRPQDWVRLTRLGAASARAPIPHLTQTEISVCGVQVKKYHCSDHASQLEDGLWDCGMRHVVCVIRKRQLCLSGRIARLPQADPARRVRCARAPTSCRRPIRAFSYRPIAADGSSLSGAWDGWRICMGHGTQTAPEVSPRGECGSALLQRLLPCPT